MFHHALYGSTWTQAVIARHPEVDAAEWASMGIEEGTATRFRERRRGLAESRTAELLEGVCDVDLDALDLELPRGWIGLRVQGRPPGLRRAAVSDLHPPMVPS